MNRPSSALVVAVSLLASGACGSGGGDEDVRAEAVETRRVIMPRHYRFEPPAIRVEVGSTVTWVNRDDFTHSVEVEGLDHPEVVIPPGEEGELTFRRPGRYPYVCTFHPHDMRGRVEVVDGREGGAGG